jgi:hypothetical protein
MAAEETIYTNNTQNYKVEEETLNFDGDNEYRSDIYNDAFACNFQKPTLSQ